jgi:hypothetical protein
MSYDFLEKQHTSWLASLEEESYKPIGRPADIYKSDLPLKDTCLKLKELSTSSHEDLSSDDFSIGEQIIENFLCNTRLINSWRCLRIMRGELSNYTALVKLINYVLKALG